MSQAASCWTRQHMRVSYLGRRRRGAPIQPEHGPGPNDRPQEGEAPQHQQPWVPPFSGRCRSTRSGHPLATSSLACGWVGGSVRGESEPCVFGRSVGKLRQQPPSGCPITIEPAQGEAKTHVEVLIKAIICVLLFSAGPEVDYYRPIMWANGPEPDRDHFCLIADCRCIDQ